MSMMIRTALIAFAALSACRTVPPPNDPTPRSSGARTLPAVLFGRPTQADPVSSIPEWVRRRLDLDAAARITGPQRSEPDIFVEARRGGSGPTDVPFRVRRGESVELYAEWSGISEEVIRDKSGVTPADALTVGASITIPLNAEQLDRFETLRQMWHEARERELEAKYVISEVRDHTVRKGDSPWAICRMHGAEVPLWLLERENEGVDLSRLQVGQTLRVPVLVPNKGAVAAVGQDPSRPEQRPAARPGRDAAPSVSGRTVTVRSGDTLGRYASRHAVSVDAILRANPGLEPRTMQIGQSVVIPGGARQAAPAVAHRDARDYELRENASGARRYTTHTVRSGESAWQIAVKKYGIGPGELAAANPEIDLERLQPGTVLRVPRR